MPIGTITSKQHLVVFAYKYKSVTIKQSSFDHRKCLRNRQKSCIIRQNEVEPKTQNPNELNFHQKIFKWHEFTFIELPFHPHTVMWVLRTSMWFPTAGLCVGGVWLLDENRAHFIMGWSQIWWSSIKVALNNLYSNTNLPPGGQPAFYDPKYNPKFITLYDLLTITVTIILYVVFPQTGEYMCNYSSFDHL